LHCGEKRNDALRPVQFHEPTVISHVTADTRIAKQEVVGPVMCIVIVPQDDDYAFVALDNDCPFELGRSFHCAKQSRGMAIEKQLRSGMLTVNDFGVNYLIQSLPFGGVADSGFGRFAGPEGLRACCLERSIFKDRIPYVRTYIPPLINYPIQANQGLPFGMSLLHLFYNESWIAQIKGIFGLIQHAQLTPSAPQHELTKTLVMDVSKSI